MRRCFLPLIMVALISDIAFIYLIDPQFRLRLTFPFGVKSGDILSDRRYLIAHAPAD